VYDAKLLQVSKQGSSIKVFEVPCTIDSLNTDDCFVLDAGAKIYVYHGAEASPFEKNKSTRCATPLRALLLAPRTGSEHSARAALSAMAKTWSPSAAPAASVLTSTPSSGRCWAALSPT
jgi:hypothetical protein